jgi:hypothetical protein
MNKMFYSDVLNEENCSDLLNICKQTNNTYLQKTNSEHKPLIRKLYAALSACLYKYSKMYNEKMTNLLLKDFELCKLYQIDENDKNELLYIYFFIEDFENTNEKKINKGTLLISNTFYKFDTQNNVNIVYGKINTL